MASDQTSCVQPRPAAAVLPCLLLYQILAVMVSGAILWSAFPPAVPGSDGAWFALAPLLLVVRHVTPRRAFWLGWLGGAVFWLLSLTWLWRLIWNNGPWPLVVFGHVALALYCGLYTGMFALAAAFIWRAVRCRETLSKRLAAAVVAEPLLWVGAEYLRCVLFSGFAWHAVGVSQQGSLALLQAAAWGGVYAVSAVVLLVNGAVAGLCERVWGSVRQRTTGEPLLGGRWRTLETLIPLLILACVWKTGFDRVQAYRHQTETEPVWQLAMVQPNAPSICERDDGSETRVCTTLIEQTTLAAATQPDLVVWPETALMGHLPHDPAAMALASNGAVMARAPLLTGTVEIQPGPPGHRDAYSYYNSAWLFTPGGAPCGRYRKQHLVPFGEYIPLDNIFPVLARLSPVGFSCTAGRESTVLHVVGRVRADGTSPGELAFSPLICFEDTVASLARRAVKAGARLLVNVTNDSWFGGSSEPEQHLAQAVFRSVECGVPMVRAANTGVTCAIDAIGRRAELQSDDRTSGFIGFHSVALTVPRLPLPTAYLHWGDWILARPAALALLAVLALAAIRARRSRP